MRGLTPYPAYRESGVAWVDHVPGHWRIAKVKHLVEDMRAGEGITSERIEPSGAYPVYGGNGLRGFSEAFTHDGTFILIGRQGALCGNVHMAHGRFWASEHALAAKPSSGTDARWLAHLLEVMDLGQYSLTAAQPGIGVAQIERLGVPIPPPAEQRAIADFLDRETGQIDRLIEKQEQLIDTLRERRAAVVAHAVTRGLDPRAPLKETHVAWLGEVPAHWELRPLWSMFERIKDVDHPDEPMLSVFRDHGVVYKDSMANLNVTADNRSIYQLVHPGWLVSNRMKAWQGSVGISGLRGIVSGHYICFAPRHDEDDAYLNYLFRSPRYAAGYRLISRGVRIGQAEIDNDDYRVLPVLVPPLAEQRAIAEHLDDQTAKIEGLIGRVERFIGLARERRAALVSAAVTGRIDVRGAV